MKFHDQHPLHPSRSNQHHTMKENTKAWALELLKTGLSIQKVAKQTGLHYNTVSLIRKAGSINAICKCGLPAFHGCPCRKYREDPNPAGICMCGCKQLTKVVVHAGSGYLPGQHCLYLPGHRVRLNRLGLSKSELAKRSYEKHKVEIRARQRKRYAEDAEYREKVKRRQRDWMRQRREAYLAQHADYRRRHANELSKKQSARRCREYEKHLAKEAQRRAKNRKGQRRYATIRAGNLEDGYIRELLRKQTGRSSKSFTAKEISDKRKAVLTFRSRPKAKSVSFFRKLAALSSIQTP